MFIVQVRGSGRIVVLFGRRIPRRAPLLGGCCCGNLGEGLLGRRRRIGDWIRWMSNLVLCSCRETMHCNRSFEFVARAHVAVEIPRTSIDWPRPKIWRSQQDGVAFRNGQAGAAKFVLRFKHFDIEDLRGLLSNLLRPDLNKFEKVIFRASHVQIAHVQNRFLWTRLFGRDQGPRLVFAQHGLDLFGISGSSSAYGAYIWAYRNVLRGFSILFLLLCCFFFRSSAYGRTFGRTGTCCGASAFSSFFFAASSSEEQPSSAQFALGLAAFFVFFVTNAFPLGRFCFQSFSAVWGWWHGTGFCDWIFNDFCHSAFFHFHFF